MNLISDFLQRKEIDDFARTMAAQFERRLPIARLSDGKRRNAEMDILTGHIQGFHRKADLGMYGKSRLVNTLRWELLDRGYDEEIIRQFCFDLAQKVATPKQPPA